MYFIFVIAISLVPNFVCSEEEKYTGSELNTIKEFRERVMDVIVHDYEKKNSFLIRWLRAQDMDLNRAEDMFRENQRWRKGNKIDQIANESILVIQPEPYIMPGFDKMGNPVLMYSPFHIDARRLLIQGKRDKLMRYWFQALERGAIKTRDASQIFGKDITKVTSVLDSHGFNIRQHFCWACVSVLREFFITMRKYYPEMAAHLVVVNLPRIAIPLIDVIRSLLSPSTAKTLRIFPQDKREWSKYLLGIIDRDQLPYRYGGTADDSSSLNLVET